MSKYEEMVKKAIEMLEEDDDLFCEMVDTLDSWNGFADGFKCWEMEELNDFYYGVKATDLINDLTSDFNINDNYFYFSIYGLESTNDKIGLYRTETSSEEVFDNVLNNLYKLSIFNTEFADLMEDISNYEEEDEEE